MRLHPVTVKCPECGGNVHRDRLCYVVPVCHGCLPPPPPIPTLNPADLRPHPHG